MKKNALCWQVAALALLILLGSLLLPWLEDQVASFRISGLWPWLATFLLYALLGMILLLPRSLAKPRPQTAWPRLLLALLPLLLVILLLKSSAALPLSFSGLLAAVFRLCGLLSGLLLFAGLFPTARS